uniref:Protein kinase domain-containing protein n=1 Tax=Dicentrarchus labrax TaxID=13489 RepID=A0A8C4HV66_DICLA
MEPRSLLAECHKVESFLGEGGFGFVTKCHNLVTDKMEAIKVNKNHPSVFHQARAEIAILKRLQCLDPDTCNIVKWNGYFFDRDHVCLNFELLDQSLYSYMVGRDFRGLSMAELRPILFQLATTLSHLRSMDIVHADLKPDNVMIVDSKKQPLKVKLIDFGLARPVSAVEPGVCVQTTWYRAPEVMLHLPFDEAIDVWSLGLVAAELATGSPLYPGDTEYDVLRFILETQGQPADDRMLELDPDQRIKPLEVLQHPFFAQSPPQSSPGNICVQMPKEEPPTVSQQPSCYETAGPENTHCRVETTASLPLTFMLFSGGQTQLTLSSLSFFRAEELKIYKGSLLAECHKVESFLGEGGFGFVTKCHNLVTDKMEAIKVNKNHPSVFHQARAEIAILKRLQCLDPDTCNIVKWNGYFFDRDHVCLNFELLDQSLYSYMVGRDFRGLSMAELRPILFQLATTLSHLRSMDIVHADLKPDNVMIVDSKKQPLKVKLIDFGLARPVSAVEPGVCVQTTWYRAPEVMLHLPFDEAIDVWSLGLVAAELHWMFKSPEQFAYETGVCANETRCQRLKCLDDLEHLMMDSDHQTEQRLLVDLIKRMLELDPDQRIKPLEVLQHPFFAQSPPQSSPGNICVQMPKEEPPTVSQQPSCYETAGPENTHCRVGDNRLPGCRIRGQQCRGGRPAKQQR